MADQANTLGDLAHAGAVPPRDFADQPQRVSEVASVPLELPELASSAAQVSQAGHFDPTAIEEAIIALSMGHLILAGPPGTGKTSLARALAHAFNAELVVETANPEWSVYDTIGTQTLMEGGQAGPRHGLVTNAILACATAMVDRFDNGEGPQAVWLLIDEMNRADIDRAFGPLFTALAGGEGSSMVLDYMDGRPSLCLPRRFRIIATVNEYDTRFVNSMSGALRRRFAKVAVLPPPSEKDGLASLAEWTTAANAAVSRTKDTIGTSPSQIASDLLVSVSATVRAVLGFTRSSPLGSIPVGTAQLIDVAEYLLTLASLRPPEAPGGEMELLDRALVARLMPGLETDSTRARLQQGYVEEFRSRFPFLPKFSARLEAFLSGLD